MLILFVRRADDHDVQTARIVLQRAADYHGRLLQLSQTPGQHEADECTQLEAQWTTMRIVLVSLSVSNDSLHLLIDIRPGRTTNLRSPSTRIQRPTSC